MSDTAIVEVTGQDVRDFYEAESVRTKHSVTIKVLERPDLGAGHAEVSFRFELDDRNVSVVLAPDNTGTAVDCLEDAIAHNSGSEPRPGEVYDEVPGTTREGQELELVVVACPTDRPGVALGVNDHVNDGHGGLVETKDARVVQDALRKIAGR